MMQILYYILDTKKKKNNTAVLYEGRNSSILSQLKLRFQTSKRTNLEDLV